MQTQTSGLLKIHSVCISDSLFQQRGIFKQVNTFLHKQRCIYIHTRRSAVYTRREMKAVEVCLFVNNQIWRVTLEPLCAYVGGVEVGGRKFGDTAHALIWEWRGAGLSRGGRDADGEGSERWRGGERRESFYMERSLRGEWPHYFWPQREREKERERDTDGELGAEGEKREKMRRRDKGGLAFINTIAECHCCHLPSPPFGSRLISPTLLPLLPFPLPLLSNKSRLKTL